MHILAILSALLATTAALPFVLPDASAHGDREQAKDQTAVKKLAEGALVIGGAGGGLYGAHQIGQKNGQRELHKKIAESKTSGFLRGYSLGRGEERLRFLSVVGLINECIDELSKEVRRLSAETDTEYRARLEDTCRDKWRLADHPMEGYRIPQPLPSEGREKARARTAERQSSDQRDDVIEKPTQDDSSPPDFWLSKLGVLVRRVGALNQVARPGLHTAVNALALP